MSAPRPPRFLVISLDAWLDGPGIEVCSSWDTLAEAEAEARVLRCSVPCPWVAVYRLEGACDLAP